MTLHGARQLWAYVALAVADGRRGRVRLTGRTIVTPEIVPTELLAGALAMRSIAGQAATVAGPAIGGLLFAIRPEAVYAAGVVLLVASGSCSLTVTAARGPRPRSRIRRHVCRACCSAMRFIRESPIILGAITLDLFAVLFGGAVALLPLFARSILHTGPFGLGLLRSAIAVGALIGGDHAGAQAAGGHAGRTLLLAVGTFGASIVVFGLSHWFIVSLLALAVSGFVDMLSMNIRSTMVALATPNHLRGRVNAVEGVFISASNELGAFESGQPPRCSAPSPPSSPAVRSRSRWRSSGAGSFPSLAQRRPARGRAPRPRRA